ncbi:hypothetical protein [Halpernia frigidisoli]|uniref:Cytoplasmic protein n=1 Tax=Halpernia frigidisoli TaxID=1125876 RepID=A0A1I3F2Z0_9FLAO|nr:hypothetical protein [Halpernia frigidisoli]SFI05558.1 hypothetical protein SAMN05443292_1120 [Halpernia frigidisoli]
MINTPKYTVDFLKNAHQHISSNKKEILDGNLCGCMVCLATFAPAEIPEFVLEPNLKTETAVCPKCQMDCVLSSEFPVDDPQFLEEMHQYYITNKQY